MLTYIQAFVWIIVGRLNIKSERGATAVEYGIMVALIAVVVIVGATLLGEQISALFSAVGNKIKALIPA